MKRYIIISIIFLAGLFGVSFAESIDISDDLQKNAQMQRIAPVQQSANPAARQGNTVPGNADVMTDIIDIKPPETIGYDKRFIKYGLIILLIILLVCLVIYLIDYFIKRRKKKVVENIVVIPADVEAFRLLDALRKESGLDAREYYFRLTAILRGYIAKRFEIDAPEMTTEELLPRLNELECEKKLIIDIKSVLTSTDPVKYAGAEAVKDKMESDYKTVKEFVRLTPPDEPDSEGENQNV